MTFSLINLPSELLVQIFGFLDFQSFTSMKSTCKVANNVAEKNIKCMPKKEAYSMGIYYGYRRTGNSLSIVETCFTDKNKALTFGNDDNLKRYLSNLKITYRLFIDEYNQSYADHFMVGPIVENVEIVTLSNKKKSISSSDILPLFKAFKKCNEFHTESESLFDGKLSVLLKQMDFCFSLCFCGDCNLEIDDECLKIITSKSSPLTPTLIIYAPDLPSSISLTALIAFLKTTHFSQNASISLSHVFGSRHDLITAFSPFIQLVDSEATIYDFKAIICVSEDIPIRLNICNLEAPAHS